MRLRLRKYSKTVPGCFVIVFLLYLFYLNNLSNVTEYKSENKNFTLSRQNTKRKEHLNKLLEHQKFGIRKFNKTISYGASGCGPVLFPFLLAQIESWSKVDKNRSAFVFSAYLVDRQKIVIIGIKAMSIKPYYCQIWYQNQTQQKMEMKIKRAEIITVPEGHGLRYTPALFQCLLSTSTGYEFPTHVSMVQEKCRKPEHLLELRIVNTEYVQHRNSHRMFTVCLSPLNFRFNRDYEIIEWIELNRILGAEQFIVYNYSSGSDVQTVLEYYSKRGIIKVVPWNLPVKVDTLPRSNKPEIHYFGQVAALHDCLYRNKGISEFIVNLDLDEFIIPHDNKTKSWSDIIQQVKQNFNAYLFRNTFFKKEWDNSDIDIQNKSLVDKLQLVTLQKLQHEQKLFSPRSRSKYIAKTANVSHLMIHEVPGVNTKVVPPELAFLHHYRDWGTKNDSPRSKVLDNTVPNKFGNTLVKNVLNVRNDIEKIP
ncbi:uncharacterized protein LOC132725994 [Ruditapes philippinarum]|uniref:uncharacterized protein LOC132725994 n=1 Tax=Ruditapes philippinarum TaxID=129788 RepID=UPI00295BF9ED|nr:uncharacterized protein LOC132725994 [Ruditapes philippinarum]